MPVRPPPKLPRARTPAPEAPRTAPTLTVEVTAPPALVAGPGILRALNEFQKGNLSYPAAVQDVADTLADHARCGDIVEVGHLLEAVDSLIYLPAAQALVAGFEKARARALAKRATGA